MPGGIFLLDPDGGLTEMAETAFAAEVEFQELLARHPGLLPGDQIDPEAPRRWLLVAREVSVPDETGSRWALDHLFLDQDGVPTLVEVKRGSDSRTRREVVGQLLDYAAHAVVSWTEETIRTCFQERCRRDGLDPDEALVQVLGTDVPASDFWPQVKTNLQAGKIRLIFVADAIPSELRRVVEFLNQQMDPAEVLAVEIRQYAGGSRKTLVPRVLGQTSETLTRKTGGGRIVRQWSEPDFFTELAARRGEAEAEVARRILRWAEQKGCRIWWGRGAQSGSFLPMIDHEGEQHWTIAVWTYGSVEVQFVYMRRRRPFDADVKRRELLRRFNAIPGVAIPEDGIERRPNLSLQAFAAPGALDRLLEVLDWVVDEIRLGSDGGSASGGGLHVGVKTAQTRRQRGVFSGDGALSGDNAPYPGKTRQIPGERPDFFVSSALSRYPAQIPRQRARSPENAPDPAKTGRSLCIQAVVSGFGALSRETARCLRIQRVVPGSEAFSQLRHAGTAPRPSAP